LVDNEDEKLLGTLSEGNMSKDLAKGCDLKSPVVKLMNRELCSLFEDVTENRAMQLMNKKGFH